MSRIIAYTNISYKFCSIIRVDYEGGALKETYTGGSTIWLLNKVILAMTTMPTGGIPNITTIAGQADRNAQRATGAGNGLIPDGRRSTKGADWAELTIGFSDGAGDNKQSLLLS